MIAATSCATCDSAEAASATSPVTIAFLVIFVVFLLFDSLTNLRALNTALKQGGVLSDEATLLAVQKRGVSGTTSAMGVELSFLNGRRL